MASASCTDMMTYGQKLFGDGQFPLRACVRRIHVVFWLPVTAAKAVNLVIPNPVGMSVMQGQSNGMIASRVGSNAQTKEGGLRSREGPAAKETYRCCGVSKSTRTWSPLWCASTSLQSAHIPSSILSQSITSTLPLLLTKCYSGTTPPSPQRNSP